MTEQLAALFDSDPRARGSWGSSAPLTFFWRRPALPRPTGPPVRPRALCDRPGRDRSNWDCDPGPLSRSQPPGARHVPDFSTTARPDQGRPAWPPCARDGGRARRVSRPARRRASGRIRGRRDARLAWLTGFTGSAGFCGGAADIAGLFVDGRYRVQARAQTDAALSPRPWPDTGSARLAEGPRALGRVHRLRSVAAHRARDPPPDRGAAGTGHAGRRATTCRCGLAGQQPAPAAPAHVQPGRAGRKAHGDKRGRLWRPALRGRARAAVLTLPDSIAWLLNIRGSDIPRNPIRRPSRSCTLRCARWTSSPTRQAWAWAPSRRGGARTRPVDFVPARCGTSTGRCGSTRPPARWRYADAGDRRRRARSRRDPCAAAQGAARPRPRSPAPRPRICATAPRWCEFLPGSTRLRRAAWPDRPLTEIAVVTALERLSVRPPARCATSASTRSPGSGPNGAIVHYRVTEDTNRRVRPGSAAGRQRRAVRGRHHRHHPHHRHRHPPDAEARQAFTRVLQGMIAVISRLRFPRAWPGATSTPGARRCGSPGRITDHGTGHGVGSYLSVHEGPQRLSRAPERAAGARHDPVERAGLYREGAFGIRIENLVDRGPSAAPDSPARHVPRDAGVRRP